MKRAVPWVVAVIAVGSATFSFSELSKLRARYAEAIKPINFHVHHSVREFIIRASFEGLVAPIVVFGDSITEMTRLPDVIGGTPVVNAGIGGAAIGDFVHLAPMLLDGVKPSLCVIALGANDALGGSDYAGKPYAVLLSKLRPVCPILLAVGVPTISGAIIVNDQIKVAAKDAGVSFVEASLTTADLMPDHIHPNAAGREKWASSLTAAISLQRRHSLQN